MFDGDEEEAASKIRTDRLLSKVGVQRWHALMNIQRDTIMCRSLADLDELEEGAWNLTFETVMVWPDAVPRWIMPVAGVAMAFKLGSFATKVSSTQG